VSDVVADSGPIIHLSMIGASRWLGQLYERVLVPATVYQEVVDHGRGLPGSRELAEAD